MAICSAAFINSGVCVSWSWVALAAKLPKSCCRFILVLGSTVLSSFLQGLRVGTGITTNLSEPGKQANRLNNLFFLQRHDSARPGSSAFCHSRTHRHIGNAANRSAARYATSGLSPFCGRDELQQFLRIVEPFFEFWSQGLRQSSRNADLARGRVSGDKLDLVDADRRLLVIPKSVFDLFGDVLSLGAGHGKGSNQTRKILYCDRV